MIGCVKKFTAVVPWQELCIRKFIETIVLLKVVLYNKHLVESAQLGKISTGLFLSVVIHVLNVEDYRQLKT